MNILKSKTVKLFVTYCKRLKRYYHKSYNDDRLNFHCQVLFLIFSLMEFDNIVNTPMICTYKSTLSN